MEISKENEDKLKKIAIAGAAAIAGAKIVHYIWKQEKIQAYIYHMPETGSTFVGLVKDKAERLAQFSGRLVSKDEFSIENVDVSEEDIDLLDTLFNEEKMSI